MKTSMSTYFPIIFKKKFSPIDSGRLCPFLLSKGPANAPCPLHREAKTYGCFPTRASTQDFISSSDFVVMMLSVVSQPLRAVLIPARR